MAIKKIFIFASILLLFGCSSSKEEVSTGIELSNKEYFSVHSQAKFDYKYIRPDNSIAYTNFAAPKSKLDSQDISVEIYTPSLSCSPSITGASQAIKLANTNGIWGRVDFFDGNADLYNPDPAPLCVPPEYVKVMKPTAYAFCSQKGEKTVLICISQMTDNPQLAEEIFSTFKWLP